MTNHRFTGVQFVWILLTLTWKCCSASARNENSIRTFGSLDQSLSLRGGSSASTLVKDEATTLMDSSEPEKSSRNEDSDRSLLIVFSDLDGTLIHYPESKDDEPLPPGILQLPPSSTGLFGIISSQTLAKCRQLRTSGVKLVLVSGMRSLTLLKRLSYLPKADAYCCEAGGRIYYPTTTTQDASAHQVVPVAYEGATEEDLEPFYLLEDMEWRKRMEHESAAGPDGFDGDEATSVKKRVGALWQFARSLQEQGFVLDTMGYATCFRVNQNQQTTNGLFDKLLNGEIAHPPELATSVNLGCIDFYPRLSGKKHCCEYLAEKFGGSKQRLSKQCVCICDDDNDVEMALACAHAYIPSISSDSMLATIRDYPTKFTLTSTEGSEGVSASEAALNLILERIEAIK